MASASPGDEGLVHLHLPGEDRGIRRDLAPGGQFDDVLPHQCVRRQLRHRPVPDGPDFGGREQRQLFNGALGPQLLDDADDGVGGYDKEEGHVLPVPHQQQTHCQHHKNQVKICQQIFPHDLLVRLGRRGHRPVVPTVLCQCLCLGGGQALVRCRVQQGASPGDRALRFPAAAPCGSISQEGFPLSIIFEDIIPIPPNFVQGSNRLRAKIPGR